MKNSRNLKFSSNVHLMSLNKLYQYCHAGVILENVQEVCIFNYMHRLFVSALEHARAFTLGR